MCIRDRTNTYRLTFLKKNIDKDIPDFSVSVPADTISSIIKIIKGLDNEVIKVYKEEAHLYFQYKDTCLLYTSAASKVLSHRISTTVPKNEAAKSSFLYS